MTTKALKTSFLLGLTALIAFTSCSEEQQFRRIAHFAGCFLY